MKLIALLWALLAVGAARAESPIQVTLEWLNHAEMKCESCSTQNITNDAGAWCVIGAKCSGHRVYLKIVARWQGEAIEVSLTRESQGDGNKFVDDGPSVSVVVRQGEVKQVELRGFKYAISAKAAPQEKPDKAPDPTSGRMPGGGSS